jgi:hypothetical protein
LVECWVRFYNFVKHFNLSRFPCLPFLYFQHSWRWCTSALYIAWVTVAFAIFCFFHEIQCISLRMFFNAKHKTFKCLKPKFIYLYNKMAFSFLFHSLHKIHHTDFCIFHKVHMRFQVKEIIKIFSKAWNDCVIYINLCECFLIYLVYLLLDLVESFLKLLRVLIFKELVQVQRILCPVFIVGLTIYRVEKLRNFLIFVKVYKVGQPHIAFIVHHHI